jgi:preprotein translocase subunit YajC
MTSENALFVPVFTTLAQQDAGFVAAPGAPGAATERQPLGAGAPPTGAAPAGPGSMLLPIVFGMLLLMVMTTMMSSRKEKKKRATLLAGIKKNDRVQTIGGIIGSVAEVRKDEIVLRVDESSNVRIRFAKSAISGVLTEAPGGADRAIEDKATRAESEPVGASA